MLGTKDIKIRVNWTYSFIGYGRTIAPAPGVVFADVGNCLVPGVIDHHEGDAGCKSTASTIIANPHLVLNHLLGSLVDEFTRRPWAQEREVCFEFVTHNDPDWDGVCSLYLVKHLVQYGQLPDRATTEALLISADLVDQGFAKIGNSVNRPYLIFQMTKELGKKPQDAMQRGCELIDAVIGLAKQSEKKAKDWLIDPVPIDGLSQFSNEISALSGDFKAFEQDKKQSITFDLELACGDGSAKKVKGFAFKSLPQCKLHKYWVRETEDADLLVVPSHINDASNAIDRYIISVKPESQYSLRRLGFELEVKEKKCREARGWPARSGMPRFDDAEYCDNDDPWYDGRGHDFTIVDSPSSYSCLKFDEILEIVKSRFHAVKLRRRKLTLFAYTDHCHLPPSKLATLTKCKPFDGVRAALGEFSTIELYEKQLTRGIGRVIYSPRTQHLLIQFDVPEEKVPERLDDWPVFLEEIRRDFGGKSSSLARQFIQEAGQMLGLDENVWEKRCFALCSIDPDLRQHDLKRAGKLFEEIACKPLSEEDIKGFCCSSSEKFIAGPAGMIFRADKDSTSDVANCANLILYALLQKSGFNVFSVRLAEATSGLRRDPGQKKLPAQDYARVLDGILKLQVDFSGFLGAVCVSEVSGDQSVQALFTKIGDVVRMNECRGETQEEMERLGELVNGLEQQNQADRNKILNGILLGVFVLTAEPVIYTEVKDFQFAHIAALLGAAAVTWVVYWLLSNYKRL